MMCDRDLNRSTLLKGLSLLLCAVCPFLANAQGESLSPLHARPSANADVGRAKSGLNEVLIYQYLPQSLPIMDDFSVDRTRSLWAQPGDPDVTLTDTYYRLEVAGVSTPDQAFRTDTTYLYTILVQTNPDTIITTITPNPSTQVTLFDLTVVPPTSSLLTGWPPYTQYDTVGGGSFQVGVTPDLVQDSLFVYSVAPDTRTYLMNGSPVPMVLWEEDYVYINGTYPVDPPTIGVATFDGLDRTGFPYRFDQPTAWGPADKMTSVPIDLSGLVPSDSVYLSFLYQPQGLSGDDQVQPIDSLLLEFYAPIDDAWYLMWWSPYFALAPFENVMVPITDPRFLHNGFRMRYSNRATLSGALDHWHLDYVRLAANRSSTDTVIVDVAYVYPESSLLQTYTSVPFKAFELSPASYMAATVEEEQRNLDVVDKFITWGALSGIEGGPLNNSFGAGNNISGNAASSFPSVHPVASNAPPFLYDPSLSTDAAFWRVKLWTNATPDINRYNDTISFFQELSNYYAYDDGSAEAGYSLNVSAAKLAYRFDLATPDSLRAIRCYFDPVFEDPSSGSFLITIWSSLVPPVIIHQNVSFSSPEYRMDGLNKFVEYPLDSTIWVQGTIYVGWVQTTADKLNLGFDKNRNNQDKIFYQVSGPFVNTSYQGSLMLRPVFVTSEDPFLEVPELNTEADRLTLYPNPASERFNLEWTGATDRNMRVQVIDGSGRVLGDWPFFPGTPVRTGSASAGTYIVRLLDGAGTVLATERIILQP